MAVRELDQDTLVFWFDDPPEGEENSGSYQIRMGNWEVS